MPATAQTRRRKGRSARGRPWHRFDIQGKRFGDLFAIRPLRYSPDRGWIWEMRCDRKVDGKRCGNTREVFARERFKYHACARCTGKGVDILHYPGSLRRRGRPSMGVTAENYERIIRNFSRRERELFDDYMGNRTREGKRGARNMIGCCELVLMERRKAGN